LGIVRRQDVLLQIVRIDEAAGQPPAALSGRGMHQKVLIWPAQVERGIRPSFHIGARSIITSAFISAASAGQRRSSAQVLGRILQLGLEEM
jgi:hypothetical protein